MQSGRASPTICAFFFNPRRGNEEDFLRHASHANKWTMATTRPSLKSELFGKFLILSSCLFGSNDFKTLCKLLRPQTLICTMLFKGATQGCLPPCVFINTVAGKEALCFRTQSIPSKLWKLISKIGFKMIISLLSVSRGRNTGSERTDRFVFTVRRDGAGRKARGANAELFVLAPVSLY